MKIYYKINNSYFKINSNWIIKNLPIIIDINGGSAFTTVINQNGLIWTWGLNSGGQLGDNTSINKSIPASILGAKKTFCQTNTGADHSLGIDYNGLVWGWGTNNSGQLGNNSGTSRSTPVSILGAKKTFCQIVGGAAHSLGIDKNGLIWAWGSNNRGQLGENSTTSRSTPISILGAKKTFCKIAGGTSYSMGLDKNGLVWCWGTNASGELGDGSKTSRRTPVSILGASKTFCQIDCGTSHSLGIDKNGLVWTWGGNSYGQLGINSITDKCTPVSILGAKKTFCLITGGGITTLGIDKDGLVWGWGQNSYGHLGDNSTTSRRTPVSILGARKTFCQINAGVNHVLGLDKDGLVWEWGGNLSGELGNTYTISKNTPISILGARKTFCQIACGGNSSLGLDKNSLVWGWGINNLGQLGNYSIISKNTPVSVLGTTKTFCKITEGSTHSLGIDKDGLVWTWGGNAYGQLGNNASSNRSTPISILGAKKTFCKITGGSNFSLGIDKNGLIWGWGYNQYGQLGDNSITSRLTPISILGAKKTFCQIVGGAAHSLGIDKNGLIWAWGYNLTGQLGNNSITSRLTPVSILGARKTFCQIAEISGSNFSLGIDKNGLIWGWGYNAYGELGDNSTTSRSIPVSILGARKTFCQVAANVNHSLGIDKNGLIWGWGRNQYGQLGDGTSINKSIPVSILGARKTFCQIACGTSHSLGKDKYGIIWSWGYNSFGQLGYSFMALTPIQISVL